MRPDEPDEKFAAAAEYILGVLDSTEAETFRQQLATDQSLQRSLSKAAMDLSLLASSLAPVSPPAGLKPRILASIRSGSPRPQLGAIRLNEGVWRPSGIAGITYKKLYFDPPSALLTTLVRMEPDACYPAHRHSRVEQCLVLEGDLIHDGHVYGPGDFTWAEQGSLDPALQTRRGALLLIIGGKETQIIG